ncbi:DUF4159 domain-containing protein [Aliiroseovarius subalbicans]|uniref:DUF4159 domain-containing protein n=1 Tax=Aliiroseovarius subalbicans TaxID=2925840 RepID=UPI001F57AABB|nr:DUF4159 domain-containing protein [Aliiroseovarius subalbicans]MCI2400727.1 DUF4159 domain-containing protein [Aliiroseovarius subalbicans]
MFGLGLIGFTTPLLLAALIALPVLWWLLRAVPPAPIRRRFPGVALLLGLEDEDQETDRTPWWLLLLRMAAIAALILGFAGPVLNPDPPRDGAGPLLVFIDDGWAAATDWSTRIDAADAALAAAEQSGRRAALVTASEAPEVPALQAAGTVRARLAGLVPVPWSPGFDAALGWAAGLEETETLWLSDGVARDGRGALYKAFNAAGVVTILEPPAPRLALRPAVFENGVIALTVLRNRGGPQDVVVSGFGPDPGGIERELARVEMEFPDDDTLSTAQLSLPPELRNRVTRFQIEGIQSAGAVSLTDDSLKRRRVALLGGAGAEVLELLSPLHYLRQALVPSAEVIEGPMGELIRASPDVMILADVATLAEPDQRALAEWVAQGGLLLRFAGPRLAGSDAGRGGDDILLPVRLRVGGRNVGGAMSWGEPRALAPFSEASPFFGLALPDDVTVSAQVLAEPGPDLAARTIASLADGTPLVTRKTLGDGQVVLFHVSANAEWSSLPLSGLFVEMLERLAVSTRPSRPEKADLAGTSWLAEHLLDGFGVLAPVPSAVALPGEVMVAAAGPDLRPGLYAEGDRRLAVNVVRGGDVLAPARWPAGITPGWGELRGERPLGHWLLTLALALLAVDILAALTLSGRLRSVALILAAMLVLTAPGDARAQSEALISAAGEVTLAHVLTGDGRVDDIAKAGLRGLSDHLFARTSVEPAPPVGVDLESDELSVFPLLYWPVTEMQAAPSPAAYARLNRYLNAGGMILFDTRDANVAGFGATTPTGRRLRALARPLDIPPLEPIPADHVLTRTFYLLSDFPGRHTGTGVWVEAAPADAEQAEGMPFRNLNDGVSPVVIGGNDWAGAWAVDAQGAPMLPVGRGLAGDRQREMAVRFGVNLVMHVLTGNYKSDQVHVPALLERLGQ